MIDFINGLKIDPTTFLITLLTISIIASVIDFLFGWLNAIFNKRVTFESGKALYGIVKKMMYFIVLTFFMFITLFLLDEKVAIPALSVLFIGYIASEINSVLAHLRITDDGKKSDLFGDFIKRTFERD